MRSLIITLMLALTPVLAFAAEEAAEATGEAAIGISNLILIVGIGAVVVVALVLGRGYSGPSGD
jgi:hypothetical protein